MTDSPLSDSSATFAWRSALVPTSMPRVGSSRMRARAPWRAIGRSAPSAGYPPTGCRRPCRIGRSDVECRHVLGHDRLLFGRRSLRHPLTRLDAEHDVLGDGEFADDALGAAILGREGDAMPDGVTGSGHLGRLAVHLDGARSRPGRRRTAAGPTRCAPSRGGRRCRRSRPRRRRGRPARAGRRLRRRPVARGRASRCGRFRASAVCGDRLEVLELVADHLGHQVLPGQVVGAGTRRPARPLRRTVMRSEIS